MNAVRNILKINNKFYDFGCKNESFLLTAKELKALGIKNWMMCLEIKYPQLGVQDLDPWDENLSAEDIGKIIIESRDNIWYYFRCVLKIPAKGAPKPYDPLLTRASHAAIWCYDHSIDFLLDQPRQTHKTTFITGIMTHAFLFDLHNVDIPYLHIKDSRAGDNATMLRDYITDGLPSYMNPWKNDKRPPGVKSIRYEKRKNTVKIISSAESEDKARDKLRGLTLYTAFFDEYEYMPYIASILSGAKPAMHSARENARASGGKCCIMYASTPGNLDTTTGKEAQRIIDKTPRFSEKFYDLTNEELHDLFAGNFDPNDPESKPLTIVYIFFNWKQLRKTERWVREQYLEAVQTNKIDEYRRGVLQERYRGSGNVILFRQKDVDYIKDHKRQPDHEILLLKKYIMYVYNHDVKVYDLNSPTPYFDMSIPYLIGIDPSEGVGGDNTAICIIHPYTLQVVAELQSPYLGEQDTKRIITQLAYMLPKAVFCLESNRGRNIAEWVLETSLEHRFYHDKALDISKQSVVAEHDIEGQLKKKAKEKTYIGTWLTPQIRDTFIRLLKILMKEYHDLINTEYVVKDILNLTIFKNGKVAAEDGEHDDMIMAYMHAAYILQYGEVERFGIDKTLCTYNKSLEILQDYENKVNENSINNMIPSTDPYENQLLHDLTKNDVNMAAFNSTDGTDMYGYTRQHYDHTQQNNDVIISSKAALSLFAEVNSNFLNF